MYKNVNELKINIFFKFHKDPWGGGNQFLKALRIALIKKGVYESNPEKANCIIFNSHQNIKDILRLKLKNPKKVLIHRIDGPIYLIRGKDFKLDRKIYNINNLIADGTIFQSNWSKKMNHLFKLKKKRFEIVIRNAADNNIFYPKKINKIENLRREKFQLVAVSWSNNINKGFDLYQYLDNNLDFNRYSMIFIGNSPIEFKNIKHIKPLSSIELAQILRESDIYVTGSKNDPCSNSLIEALSCGLPCVVLNDGGHPEILKKGGEIFESFNECLMKIQKIRENYNQYRENIFIPGIELISNQYINFISKILNSLNYRGKRIKTSDYLKIVFKYNELSLFIFQIITNEIFRKLITIRKKIQQYYK